MLPYTDHVRIYIVMTGRSGMGQVGVRAVMNSKQASKKIAAGGESLKLIHNNTE